MTYGALSGLVLCLLIGSTATAAADDNQRGTARDAQDMVEHGILLFEDEGAANAFAAINLGTPQFRHHDLYLFVLDAQDGLVVADALHPDRVGVDALALKDVNGTTFGRNMIEQATKHGVWVDYAFENPMTGQVEPKSSWVVLHDGYVFGCGIYNP